MLSDLEFLNACCDIWRRPIPDLQEAVEHSLDTSRPESQHPADGEPLQEPLPTHVWRDVASKLRHHRDFQIRDFVPPATLRLTADQMGKVRTASVPGQKQISVPTLDPAVPIDFSGIPLTSRAEPLLREAAKLQEEYFSGRDRVSHLSAFLAAVKKCCASGLQGDLLAKNSGIVSRAQSLMSALEALEKDVLLPRTGMTQVLPGKVSHSSLAAVLDMDRQDPAP